jgi:hypothetical protein
MNITSRYHATYAICSITQIFRKLQPLDLIHLSRLTQPLRYILLNRSSRVVWLSSLAATDYIPLPQCPADLNEVQYAVLMFDPICWVRLHDVTLCDLSVMNFSSAGRKMCTRLSSPSDYAAVVSASQVRKSECRTYVLAVVCYNDL